MTRPNFNTTLPELIRYIVNGPVKVRAIDAATPREFCRWLLEHRRLYTLPTSVVPADWVRALEHFVRLGPDAAAFESELKDWQRWPPVPDLLFSAEPDAGFDIGHLLGLAWICSDAHRLDDWSKTPEPTIRFAPGRVVCWDCEESVHPAYSLRCVACGWLVCPNGHCAGPYRNGEYGPVGEICMLSGTPLKDRARRASATLQAVNSANPISAMPPEWDQAAIEAAYETWRETAGDQG